MKIVRQGDDNNCGQCCVAMLANVSLDNAIRAVGKRGLTRSTHLIKALNKLGISCDRKYTLGDDYARTGTYILRFSKFDRSLSHWVVFSKNKYYDPASGVFRKNPPKYLSKISEVTSYIKIYME